MASPMLNPVEPRRPRPSIDVAPVPSKLGPLPLFPVSSTKFVVMSIVTLDIYPVYWMYQQWKRIRDRTGENLSPFWRAAFAPLWGFRLFGHIRSEARTARPPAAWSAGLLATLYLVLSALSGARSTLWLVSLLAFLPFLPVVRTVAAINGRVPTRESRNTGFTVTNVIGGAFGALLLGLAVLGTFVAE